MMYLMFERSFDFISNLFANFIWIDHSFKTKDENLCWKIIKKKLFENFTRCKI